MISFAVNKKETVSLTNDQIAFIRENSRAKVAAELDIKEGWAKILKAAVKSGELVEVKFIKEAKKAVAKRELRYPNGQRGYNIGRYCGFPSPDYMKEKAAFYPVEVELEDGRVQPRPVPRAIYAYEKGCRTREEFKALAEEMGVNKREGNNWFNHATRYFSVVEVIEVKMDEVA